MPQGSDLPRSRARLMCSTAMLAALASPAGAQLAPNARPTGGQVSAGQASIGGNGSTTLITQSSENAAINWQSFNVGSKQSVQYVQPNAAAITLNRVVGANPSEIAGKINANGQIIIVNQSGVVFDRGSQVDTAGLVVSASGITNKNFMAGHMVFDQAAHAGAVVSNAGNITVRQAGLAALVAPQVANSGVITARLGRVVLGGATTHTLDLYGDGLVAMNITGQVTQASLGGKQVTALVTNTGTILAPGGTVVLSASAVDGVVTNLVSTSGRIAADSVGGSTGHVLVQGIGGGISMDGEISAKGLAAGTTGGKVVADATGAVNVSPGALIDVSGDAGGGVVALGTTAARAIGGASVNPTLVAQSVFVAPGAQIRANALRHGPGGRIAVLSQQSTQQGGAITARGGALGGDGGWIEVSGGKVSFGGTENVAAPHGASGSILIDPASLDIGTLTANAPAGTTLITPGTFAGFSGNVILSADGTILINQAVVAGGSAATLELLGGAGIIINAALQAPGIPVALYSSGGSITEMLGQASPGSIVASSLSAEAVGPITLTGANVIGSIGNFALNTQVATTGTVVAESSPGTFTGRGATASDTVPLTGLSTIGSFGGTAEDGSITLDNAAPLQVASGVTAVNGGVTIAVSGTATTPTDGPPVITPNGVFVSANITGASVTLSTSGSVAHATGGAIVQQSGTIQAVGATGTDGSISLSAASGAIEIGGTLLTTNPAHQGVPAGGVTLTATTGDIGESGGSIATGTLSGGAGLPQNQSPPPDGDANFALSASNTISTLTGFTAAGTFSLSNDTQLSVGNLTAGGSITIADAISSNVNTKPGILVLQGAMQAGGTISLTNAPGIAELSGASVTSTAGNVTLSTSGGISQGTNSTINSAAALVLTAGGTTDFGTYGLSTIGTIHGISFAGALTAGTASQPAGPYSGSATLTASAGDIFEGAGGSIQAGTLSAAATVGGNPSQAPFGDENFGVSSGNVIGTLLATSPTGSFALEDDSGLIVLGIASQGTVSVHGPTSGAIPSGPLIIAGNISAPQNITLDNAAGIGQLAGTSIVSTLAGVTLTSSHGAIAQAATAAISGGVTSTLGTAVAVSAGGTTIFAGQAAPLGTVAGVGIGGTLTAGTLSVSGTQYTGAAALFTTAGDILEAASGTLQIGTLLGGTGSTGNMVLEADTQLTLGNIDVGGNFTVHGPASPASTTGILIIDGVVTAGGTLTLSNQLGIAELSGASATGTLGASLTTGGAILQQSLSTLTGLSSAGTALVLSAGGSTDFNTYLPSLPAGAVHGISFGGTLTAGVPAFAGYSGLATISAGFGDILQTGGSLRAGTLTGSATGSGVQNNPPEGNAVFDVASGNTLSYLQNFSASGSFVLEDDVGLRVGNLTAGTTIDIHGPANGTGPTGFLTLAGNITANGAMNFSNSVGIIELSQASVTSLQSGVSLISTHGAVLQQAGAVLAGEENSAAGTGLFIEGDGSTNFGALYAPTGPGTVQGIAFGGTLTAGLSSNGIYAGQASLTTLAGSISEISTGAGSPTGVIQAGTLGASAPAGSIALATTSGPSLGNQVQNLGASSARNEFSLVDGQNLQVSGDLVVGAGSTTAPSLTLYTPTLTVTGSLQLTPANGVAAGPISLAADHFSISGDVSSAGGIVALDLLNASPQNTTLSVGPLQTDTMSVASAENIQTHGGTLALGSLDGTFASPGGTSPAHWSIGQGGTVSSMTLTALDLTTTNVAAALGLFSNGILNVSSGITVSSLYGSSGSATAAIGTATILGSNEIGTLGVLDSTGGLLGFSTAQSGTATKALAFQLSDTVPLTVSGPVLAGRGAVRISVTGTQASVPNAITIGGPITSGTLTASGGNITGTDIFIDAAGGIAQLTGTVQAVGTAGAAPAQSTNGTVAIIAHGGALPFSGTITGGTLSNGLYTGAVLLKAGAGDITEQTSAKFNAGTLAAQASGNVLLGDGTNTISVIGSLGIASENTTLTGLFSAGGTGITLNDTTNLLIGDTPQNTSATVSAIGLGGTGSGTGSIQIAVSNGSLTLGTSSGATLSALGGITLTAQGDVLQTLGEINSTGGRIAVTSQTGKFDTVSGSFNAGSGDISLTAGASISETASTLQAQQDISLLAGASATGSIFLSGGLIEANRNIFITSLTGNVMQVGGTVTAGENVSVSAFTDIAQDSGNILAVDNVGLSAGTGGTGSISQTIGLVQAGGSITGTAPGEAGLGVLQTLSVMTAGTALSLTSSGGSLAQIASTLTGTQSVSLDFGGPVSSTGGGTISSGNETAGGTVVISSGADISFDGTIASVGIPSAAALYNFQPSSGAVLLAAAGGNIVELPGGAVLSGTLAAAASGNITLGNSGFGNGGNYVTDIGSLSSLQPGLTLYGLSAAGTSGITFIDSSALSILGDTGSHKVIQAISTGATISIGEAGTDPFSHLHISSPLSVGMAGASTIAADSGISLTSEGDILQGLGSVITNHGSLLIESYGGNISQAGGIFQAGGGLLQDGSFASPSGSVSVLASGDISQTGGALISAHGDITITAGIGATPNSLFLFGGNIAQQGSFMRASGDIAITAIGATQSAGTGNIAQSNGGTISAGGSTTLASQQGSFTQTSSTVIGAGGVSLSFLGNIASTGSTLQSTAAAGTLSITSLQGSIVQSGTGFFGADPAGGTMLLSALGDIATSQVIAGTLAAAAAHNLTIGGTANQIASIAPQQQYPNGVLYAGLGTITLADAIPLTVQPGAVISAAAGAPFGSITLLAAGLTLDSASIQAGADINLSAGAGSLTQIGGQIEAGGSIGLQGNAITQENGGFIAAAGDVTVSAASAASFSGSTLTAGGNITTNMGSIGDFIQGGDGKADLINAGQNLSILGTAGSQQAFYGDAITQNAGATLAAGQTINLEAGGIYLAGTAQAGADINLTTGGGLAQSGGQITAGGSIAMQGGDVSQDYGGLISAEGDVSVYASGAATFIGSVLHAGHNVSIAVQADFYGNHFTQGDGLTSDVISAGNSVAINVAGSLQRLGGQYSGTLQQLSGSTMTAGQSVSLSANAGLSLSGTVQAGTLAAGSYTGSLSLDGGFGGSVSAPTATLLAGTLSAGAVPNGSIDLSGAGNEIAQIGSLTAAGSSTLRDGQSLVAAGPISSGADTTFNITGGFTETAGAPITAGTALSITATGAISLGGTVAAGTTATLTSTGAITLDGQLFANGPLNLSAGTSIDLNAGAYLAAGAGSTFVASAGTVTIAGGLYVAGTLSIMAGTDINEALTGGITVTPEASGVAAQADASLTATAGAITLGGTLDCSGAVAATAGTSFGISQGATLSAGAITIAAIAGHVTLAGSLASSGPLALVAGTDIIEAGSGEIATGSGPNSLAARNGMITLGGSLNLSGALSATAATDFSLNQGATLSAGATTIAAGGQALIAGAINPAGNFSLSAGGDITEDATGAIAGLGTGAVGSRGAVSLNGSLAFAGGLRMTAGTSITQGAASFIASSDSATLIAPGTITLAGTLTAPRTVLGDPATQSVVWNGNTILTGANAGVHGPTNAIAVPKPLSTGLGLFIDTASFEQTGTTTIAPISGNAATMQITIEGRGAARFASLAAPAAQLLLVLNQAGTAYGQIDVAGLNVFYTSGDTPVPPVNLRGTVGGHGGFAAAAVGFSHALSNANYQVNGCPIESINCVLLSPLVVPIVDPVNDYAEGTERRRRRDDDALPNVGEQDY